MDWWIDLIEGLMRCECDLSASGSSFVTGPLTVFDLRVDTFDPFELCCYTNKEGKLTLLSRNYRNEESINAAKEALKGGHSIISVSLIGKPKHGSVKNKDYCMTTLFINKDQKRATVVFRNSDVFKKLLIDVYWLKNVLMKELGIDDYELDACFNALTLRAPFFYIYLKAGKKYWNECSTSEVIPDFIANTLSTKNPLVKAFIDWYNKPTPNYKSLERAGRRMKELDIYEEIKPFLNKETTNESI